MERRWRYLLVLACGVAAHAWVFTHNGNHFWPGDSADYLAPARSLIDRHAFLDAAGRPETNRTPAYPLFVAAFLMSGLATSVMVIVQHLFAIAAALLTTTLVERTRYAASATLAGIFVAANPTMITASDYVLTEALFVLELVILLLLVQRMLQRERVSLPAALLAGVVFTALILTRPIAMWLVPVLALLFFFRARPKIAAIAFLVCSIVLPLFWAARNDRQVGRFTISTIAGENLLLWRAGGAAAIDRAGWNALLRHEGRERIATTLFAQVQPELGRLCEERAPSHAHAKTSAPCAALGRHILRDHKSSAVVMTIYSFLRLLFAPNTDLLQLLGSDARVLFSPLLLIGTSLFVLFAVAGAVIALRDRDATASVLLLVLAYFALVSSGPEVWYYPRFRAPLIVPMATLAAIAMFALMENVRKRRLIGHAE